MTLVVINGLVRINHVCIMVSDLERSVPFYRDLLGFTNVLYDVVAPSPMFPKETIDKVLGVEDATTRIVYLADDEGTQLEIQQASNPTTTRTPDEYLRYGRTGITELAFDVADVDGLFERLKAEGYETQTDFVWSPDPRVKTFLFYDPDGALIQVVGPARALAPVL